MDHAAAFIRTRLAPMHPLNDGKQTPMRGHPVFIAQHATASCCRSCLRKWHGLPKDVLLDAAQQRAILDVIRAWLMREIDQPASCVRQGSPPQGELF
ncbi:hypothetical protein NCH01_09210 [Neoasaia chiangmaiensis]|nr:hypothetical protein NCH01_09210 [Neoasaia chiangmaiensis]